MFDLAARPLPVGVRAPGLVYAHCDGETFTAADMAAPMDLRERAICRALLLHALALLDETEPPVSTCRPA